MDHQSKLHTIKARAVVMACPKFVVSKILHGIEKERVSAIRKIKYRSYIVTNVLINGEVKNMKDVYDLYLLGDGTTRFSNIRSDVKRTNATDVVFAQYANGSTQGRSVLTLYRGIPYEGGRGEILSDSSFKSFKRNFENQLETQIFPMMGIEMNQVADIRIQRWGHPLPLSEKGYLSSGLPEAVHSPFQDKIFFVEQDNWMLPAYETAAGEALYWAPRIRRVVS